MFPLNNDPIESCATDSIAPNDLRAAKLRLAKASRIRLLASDADYIRLPLRELTNADGRAIWELSEAKLLSYVHEPGDPEVFVFAGPRLADRCDEQTAAGQPAKRAAPRPNAASILPGKPRTRAKRPGGGSTPGDELVLGALRSYHSHEPGGGTDNHEPASLDELAKLSGQSKSTVSRFLKKKFPKGGGLFGHRAYKAAVLRRDIDRLLDGWEGEKPGRNAERKRDEVNRQLAVRAETPPLAHLMGQHRKLKPPQSGD
ncbi:MAG: hypothetical protein ABR915_07720 [Thermoguttaceae bacterium]|jgi:hypothetical protein